MMIFKVGDLSPDIMEHNFVNFGHISFIVSYLGRYDVGLPEYEINLRNIHVFLP